MTELQSRLSEQRDPPTRKQIEQVRVHPHTSAQLLRDSGVTDADWLADVEDHHERKGGSGYPRGLAQVDELMHVLRAADVFVAKITPRALHPALAPQAAARQLFQEEQGASVASALIKPSASIRRATSSGWPTRCGGRRAPRSAGPLPEVVFGVLE